MASTEKAKSRDLVPVRTSAEIVVAPPAVEHDPHLVEDWLAGKSERTRQAYAGDLRRFASWAGVSDLDAAARKLLAAGPRGARHLVLGYRGYLEGRGLSPATINRALAALRSVVELARDGGVIDWSLNVKGLKARAYRDTRGPSRDQVSLILSAADRHWDSAKAARDGALLRLLYGLALRRSEAVELDVGHLDLTTSRVAVLGKGQHDRYLLTLPLPVLAALTRWLERHPDPSPGTPLFTALDRRTGSDVLRLSARSVARVLQAHCRAVGVCEFAPHALRHAAITHALDATGGDVRRVRAYSRHARLDTLTIYDDHRTNGAAEIAALVAL
ncbi:tyrosine-type recombinase/integrase [Myxococcota bacterium]